MKMEPDLFSTPAALADELGELRERIRALKAREAELRAALIDLRPNGPVDGARFEVTIRQNTRQRLDPARLPDAIRNDPQYWTTSVSQTVVARPRDPGGPPDDEDIVLIEPF